MCTLLPHLGVEETKTFFFILKIVYKVKKGYSTVDYINDSAAFCLFDKKKKNQSKMGLEKPGLPNLNTHFLVVLLVFAGLFLMVLIVFGAHWCRQHLRATRIGPVSAIQLQLADL